MNRQHHNYEAAWQEYLNSKETQIFLQTIQYNEHILGFLRETFFEGMINGIIVAQNIVLSEKP